jgi:hypothetical protein
MGSSFTKLLNTLIMKKSSLTVVLDMHDLSVPEKINAATARVNAVAANPTVFINAAQLLTAIIIAIKALDTAWKNTSDGGKAKTTIMHDKEDNLMKLMDDLAHYVEGVADGDEQIVHLAGMRVKTFGTKHIAEFEVYRNLDGLVALKTKARKKAFYKWQYSTAVTEPSNWTTAITTSVSRATIDHLETDKMYWFRVVIVTPAGEHPLTPVSYVVH